MSEPDPLAVELLAMQNIASILDKLNQIEISRILRWVCDRYEVAT